MTTTVPTSHRETRTAHIPVRPTPLGKRLLDLVLAGIGLVLSAPLWGVLAVLVKLEDGGPVFFRQDRVGEGGRVFRVLKFRSMIPDADRQSGIRQATEHDPRITRIGRIMRASAMDELPQLWNIFRGDMSFVGPRALAPGEIETRGNGQMVALDEIPGYVERHTVRPGLTGIAQIFAPRDVPRRWKFKYDQIYVRNQGFWFDVTLVALSFWITFRGKWETRGRKI